MRKKPPPDPPVTVNMDKEKGRGGKAISNSNGRVVGKNNHRARK